MRQSGYLCLRASWPAIGFRLRILDESDSPLPVWVQMGKVRKDTYAGPRPPLARRYWNCRNREGSACQRPKANRGVEIWVPPVPRFWGPGRKQLQPLWRAPPRGPHGQVFVHGVDTRRVFVFAAREGSLKFTPREKEKCLRFWSLKTITDHSTPSDATKPIGVAGCPRSLAFGDRGGSNWQPLWRAPPSPRLCFCGQGGIAKSHSTGTGEMP
jgi:hypothetical protein